MCFDDIEIFKLENYVDNLNSIYAHKKDNNLESLKIHLDLTLYYFKKIIKEKGLIKTFNNFENIFLNNYNSRDIEFFEELLINSIYLHDIGKINGSFQFNKMDNNKYKELSQYDSKHSSLSSIIYFDFYLNKLKEIKGQVSKPLLLFLIINSYIISKHHGKLGSLKDYLNNFENIIKEFQGKQETYKDFKENINFDLDSNVINRINKIWDQILINLDKDNLISIYVYIYSKLVSSLLTSADFYATSHFKNNKEVKEIGLIKDINIYYDEFKKSSIYNGIEKHKDYLKGNGKKVFDDKDINKLRSEMFIEAEENLIKNKNENLFYLEAPTGSGKTITSINLAFKQLELNKDLNKIFYIFPFNTLVEQTSETFKNLLNNNLIKDIAVINSITPIKVEDKEEDGKNVSCDKNKKIDYEKALLDRQFIHYPIVLTTHINFFNYLFGCSREESFPLTHLANSVVILDEIQSYRNSIWKEIITFLEEYSSLLNIKIIIMSATLPNLEKLGSEKNKPIYLIKNREKYYSNPLFKNRVNIDYSLLEEEYVLESLKKKVLDSWDDNKVVVEFIKKKSALNFYKDILNEVSKNKKKDILLITGDDSKADRKKIINKVKKQKSILLIATQVIEAGVDIDMDLGFKDISILDSEEQFLGRINRSCKKKNSKAYFFNLDAANNIYKNDYRNNKNLSLLNEDIKEILKNKDFSKFYSEVIFNLQKSKSEFNDNSFKEFKKEVGNLNFKEVNKHMELINKNQIEYDIFLNTKVELDNGEVLYGDQVWEEYKSLIKDNKMDYAEKRIKISKIMEKVDCFTYKINKFNQDYNDNIGQLFYIEDGEQYFNEGKFDRELFEKQDGFNIL
ncbi:CRISPR-associated helicase/endonuclease Cas3 [Clostridium fallax]|uniref:CRISPR-associated helicase, Cas3 family n=1 Tax=Clostridium fallax TaxID=1533 RepID=A0A1M4XWK1_9CLOT|nr:CRISPR-associated helicase/endonuclease Cas3 [Clostridium fallax]SHE97663.1 CRISPR-associated helicase, Cas3 family [Clostridium fallax]SQB06506.1 CRISPR-associated helicase Cas3 [Clostridium fallax]